MWLARHFLLFFYFTDGGRATASLSGWGLRCWPGDDNERRMAVNLINLESKLSGFSFTTMLRPNRWLGAAEAATSSSGRMKLPRSHRPDTRERGPPPEIRPRMVIPEKIEKGEFSILVVHNIMPQRPTQKRLGLESTERKKRTEP